MTHWTMTNDKWHIAINICSLLKPEIFRILQIFKNSKFENSICWIWKFFPKNKFQKCNKIIKKIYIDSKKPTSSFHIKKIS